MDTDKLVDALTDMINEGVSNAIDEVDIADKVNDAIEELDWEEIVSDKVDFNDLVKDHADFDTAATDAIEEKLPEAIEKELIKIDWAGVIGRDVNIRETILQSVDMAELTNEALSKGFNQKWDDNERVLNNYIENRLGRALRDKVEMVVEEKLISNFHDIDRDLQDRVNPLLGEIEMLKLEIAKLKDRKPLWRKVLGL